MRLILRVRNYLLGLSTILLSNTVVYGQLSADFTSTPSSGCVPLTVNFKDISTGNPTSWKWNFGNGSQSILQNPEAFYFNSGSYTVTLTVSNASGNTSSISQNISVYAKPIANFTSSDSIGCFPLTTTFSDLSSAGAGSITNWNWNFGDGDTSIFENPTYKYTTSGNFTVTLKVTNSNGCSNVFSKSQYVKVSIAGHRILLALPIYLPGRQSCRINGVSGMEIFPH